MNASPCPLCAGAGETSHPFCGLTLRFRCDCRQPARRPDASKTAVLSAAEAIEPFRPEWKKRKAQAAPAASPARPRRPELGPNVGDTIARALHALEAAVAA